MKSKFWIKLYHEILHDPKMGILSDRLWRRTIEIFLLAGEEDCDGLLPSVDDMSWAIRLDTPELKKDLAELKSVGILSSRNGKWKVKNFDERQRPRTTAERVQDHRKRKRNDSVTKRFKKCNVNETQVEVEEESDIEVEEEKTSPCKKCGADILEIHQEQDCKFHSI